MIPCGVITVVHTLFCSPLEAIQYTFKTSVSKGFECCGLLEAIQYTFKTSVRVLSVAVR